LLRRSPLRTARAAFTASSSSKPRGRLRCVALFLTVARFPSCAAVKIRCRSRRTLFSWCRQSTASQERVASSGPFTIWCLTCPSVPALRVRFASQAHLSTSAPLSRPGHQARYPASYPATTAWRSHPTLLVSCRLSPAGIRFLDILFPPEKFRSPHGRPTGPPPGRPDSVGVPMFRTHEMRPGWVPPLPRGGGVLPTGAASPIGACRFPTASPIPR
jgi:hypothetical protein